MLKKRSLMIISLLAIVTFFTGVFSGLVTYSEEKDLGMTIDLSDNAIPLSSYGSMLITQTKDDVQIIPDKYNTGCDEMHLSTYISGPDTFYGDIGISPYGTEAMAIYISENMPSTIVFENVDFSCMEFVLAEKNVLNAPKTIIFQNCKFATVRTANRGDSVIQYYFEQCTMGNFAGSNAEFNRCYVGGMSEGDGLNPYRNCAFYHCMIADLIQEATVAEGNHVDGIQLFGDYRQEWDNMNIHLFNCRFEVPNIPYEITTGTLNCPIAFTMNYSGAVDVSFIDCYVNGGVYYSIMIHPDAYELKDVVFSNVHVGGNRSKRNVVTTDEYIDLSGISDTSFLYVASVWKDYAGIHLSVTNDTNQERTLRVITSNGDFEHVIPACPVSKNLEIGSMEYEDFPFDIEICVGDAAWVVCFDVTGGGMEQIRYVNWSGEEVYLDMALFLTETVPDISLDMNDVLVTLPNIDTNEPVIYSGMCGDMVSYQLTSKGCLILNGSGATYNYHSGKLPPWYDVRNEIQSVLIDENVTSLGSALFMDCDSLTEVYIPSGVTVISNNAFIKSNNLTKLILPNTVIEIGKYAFGGTGIADVIYFGSFEQWNQICIGDKNDVLYSAMITYYEQEELKVVQSGICGENITWKLTSDGTIRLSGTGITENYHSGKPAPWNEYADEIKTVVIEEGITALGSIAFYACTGIESVVCPNSLQTIGNNAFIKCSSLQTLTLGSELSSIGKYAFGGTSLTTVYFNGSQSDWNNVEIGGKNEPLLNATFIFNE